ncbi:hypothetical protein EWM64_g8758 [Hericium alpestre]|uniref:Carboxylesterase type B domain-containing protein n=1 Tax=Hericium alpestre TaxID=135208 RepID=A0A4Y9ZMQ4_9AGAM|nr:hypothetical protein EWM64_g8758 [Hericium alpestre]
MITGNCDDEGSLFSISSANITDEDEVRTFLKEFMLPNATDYELDLTLRHYPGLPSAGCPFDTGFRNILGPQYKRIAAIQGDVVFHSPRRFFLQHLAGRQNSWSFLSKRMKDLAFMGSAHATDILNAFGDGELRDYIIRFVNTLDPNGGRAHAWPKYDLQNPQAVVFQDSVIWPVISVQDDYRKDAMAFVANLSLLHPL